MSPLGHTLRLVALLMAPIASAQTSGPAAPLPPGPSTAEIESAKDAPGVLMLSPQESRALGQPTGLLSLPGAGDSDEPAGASARGGDLHPSEFLRVGLALGVVIGLLLLLRLTVRRMGGLAGGGRPSGVVEVLARYPIARAQQLVLLQLSGRIVLLHQSRAGMTTLSEVTDPDEVASLLAKVESGQRRRGGASEDEFARTLGRSAEVGEKVVVDLTRRRPKARVAGRSTAAKLALATLAVLLFAATASAQAADTGLNPITLMETVTEAVPGYEGGLSTSLNILVLLTVLSIAPSLLVLCTCFTRIVIVLGLMRQALGTQGLPPSQVMIGLALFITFVVMAPTFQRVYDDGIRPYAEGEVTDYNEVWARTRQPVRDFMFGQIEATGNWSGVYMILNYRGVDTSDPGVLTRSDVDMLTLVPAYVLSELKVAFLMGFRIYLPFLVIDMVIASTLISMGMLMLPPVLISLPFKLLLFVLVDGWQLVVGSLMNSVAQPEAAVQVATVVMTGGP
jgi:flagellar biosynthetic protein FliP